MMRARSRGKRAAANSAEMSLEPVELSAVREDIKNLVGNAARAMVKSGIAEANKGHYAAMKFLFELVGLYPAGEKAEQGGEENGLAKALLGRLGVVEAEPEAEVTNVCSAKLNSGSDAVE